MRPTLLVAVAMLSAFAQSQNAAKVMPGDELDVLVSGIREYSGTYKVSNDGRISGKGFDQLLVRGKTIAEIQSVLTKRIGRFVRNPKIDVTLKLQAPRFVFVTGSRAQGAAYPLTTGLNLRQLISTVALPEFTDKYLVNLFRDGQLFRTVGLENLLRGTSQDSSPELQTGDTVAIVPIPTVRVWVTGLVNRPGELVLSDGSDLYQAVAAAGGLYPGIADDQEIKLSVRRGPETFMFPSRPGAGDPYKLQSGDTITVVVPDQVRVTVFGEVKNPGAVMVRETESVIAAVARAGGATEAGTLRQMLVVRGTEQFFVDETIDEGGVKDARFKLMNGDIVVVRRNTRRVLVLGEVKNAGSIPMIDAKTYRLADVVAEAGGTGPKASTVRVYVGRPDPKTRKMVATQYRLDKFLKDGDMTQNPVIEPGDVVLVGESQRNSLDSLSQILSLAFYIDTLVRR